MATKIHILGSGTPTPTPDRFGSSYVAEVNGQFIMIDCGPAATWKLVKAGLLPTQVDTVFFTHHHFDHDVDYPCFLLTRWDQSIGDEARLKVFGPSPTVELTEKLIGPDGAFTHDYTARINWPASQRIHVNRGGTLPRRPPAVDATNIDSTYVHETSEWSMRSAVAQHAQPYLDSLAYRLDTPTGSVVFTGDTEPCESVRDLARDADLMLCMCWDTDEIMSESGESSGVCGAGGAARMAAEAGVKRLALVHTGPRLATPGNRNDGIAEAGTLYSGEVTLADELTILDL